MIEGFIIGKLYKSDVEDNSFPPFKDVMIYKPPSENYSGEDYHYLKKDSIFMVLDTLYVKSTKRRMSSKYPNGVTIRMWHLKVLVNNEIGYISVWEDDWMEAK